MIKRKNVDDRVDEAIPHRIDDLLRSLDDKRAYVVARRAPFAAAIGTNHRDRSGRPIPRADLVESRHPGESVPRGNNRPVAKLGLELVAQGVENLSLCRREVEVIRDADLLRYIEAVRPLYAERDRGEFLRHNVEVRVDLLPGLVDDLPRDSFLDGLSCLRVLHPNVRRLPDGVKCFESRPRVETKYFPV